MPSIFRVEPGFAGPARSVKARSVCFTIQKWKTSKHLEHCLWGVHCAGKGLIVRGLSVHCTEIYLNKDARKHMIGKRGDLYGLKRNPNIVSEKPSHINIMS